MIVMRGMAVSLLAACAMNAQTTPSSALPVAGPKIEAYVAAKAASPAEKRKDKYTVKIDAADWTDTGIPVRMGDSLILTANGAVKLADGRTLDPDGAGRGWRDMLRQFPMPQANAGAIVGRIGGSDATVPFLVGKSAKVEARANGHLYLRVNAPTDLFGSSSVKVKVEFGKASQQTAITNALDLTKQLPLDLFAKIPRRVEDAQHNPGDVVNFALIGTEQQVKDAFTRSGWISVDKSVEDAVVNGLFATLEKRAYLAVPMSTLYLFGRPQDMSYARAKAIQVAAERHHLRLWKTEFTVEGKPLWVGSATHDNGFERDERNGNITHRIDEDIDEEREFIRASFEASGSYTTAAYVTPPDPVSSARTATGGSFHTDGRILVMELN